MLATRCLGLPGQPACCPARPRGFPSLRAVRPPIAPRPCAGRQVGVVCYRKDTHGSSPAGQDLNFLHVASDIRGRLAASVGGKQDKEELLQAWLSEAKLEHSGESDADHGQAELVAEQEGNAMGLSGLTLDVKAWLSGASGDDPELDAKMAGVLVTRLLQAYHENAGEPFDDEEDDCYWRLQGFIPGALVEALDHDTLRRAVRAFTLLPFSGA